VQPGAAAKPGAEVLAVNPDITIEGSRPLSSHAALRRRRAMILAADTTCAGAVHPRPVCRTPSTPASGQTLRWLAGRSLDDKSRCSGEHGPPGYDVGKRVEITVTRQPRPELDLSEGRNRGQGRRRGRKTITVPMKANSAAPDEFKGGFSRPPAGVSGAGDPDRGGQAARHQATEFLVHGSTWNWGHRLQRRESESPARRQRRRLP